MPISTKSPLNSAQILSTVGESTAHARAAGLDACIRVVPDHPAPGINFRDITPLIGDAAAFATSINMLHAAVADLLDQIPPHLVHDRIKVVGVEARGFIFGAALAGRLGVGFVPARKPGKLPAPTISSSYSLEYGKDAVHLHTDAIQPGQRVIVVDDLLATGGTLDATCSLVERLGGSVMSCLFLIELIGLGGRERLESKYGRVDSVLAY